MIALGIVSCSLHAPAPSKNYHLGSPIHGPLPRLLQGQLKQPVDQTCRLIPKIEKVRRLEAVSAR